MFHLYILRSLKNGKYYVGSTKDVEKRLRQHNDGKTKSIKAFVPYELVYKEVYSSYSQARKRELYIKSRKSRKFIDELVVK